MQALELGPGHGDRALGLVPLTLGGAEELLGVFQSCLRIRELRSERGLALAAFRGLALGAVVLRRGRALVLLRLRRRRGQCAEPGRLLLLEEHAALETGSRLLRRDR